MARPLAVSIDRGFENQCMAAIGARHFGVRVARPDQPAAIVARTQKIGETGGRIEARPAQPVDRPVAPNEGRRLAIADDGVILDFQRHGGLERSIS